AVTRVMKTTLVGVTATAPVTLRRSGNGLLGDCLDRIMGAGAPGGALKADRNIDTRMAVARTAPGSRVGEVTAFSVLAGVSVAHLLNDTVQSIIPAIYPMLKESFALTFAQVGLMTLTLQLTASLLQPLVGLYTDRRPTP